MSDVQTLQQWGLGNQLSQVTLNPEGTQLTNTVTQATLAADAKHTVPATTPAGKSCEYTLASIYLQIIDPAQGLMGYRGACKRHNVKDPVKASDKATVLAYFLGTVEGDAVVPAAAEAPSAASAPEAAPAERSDKRKESSSSHTHRSSSKHASSRHDKHDKKRRSSSQQEAAKDKKKPKTAMTNETLFSNLVTVVDKRSKSSKAPTDESGTTASAEGLDDASRPTSSKKRDQLVAALTTEGFEVTAENKEMIEKSRQDAVQQHIMANETPVGNSTSILKAAAGKDLSRVLKLFLEVMQPPKKKVSAEKSSGSRPHLIGQKPIIIIPKGMTAPLTMVNAHEFFCNSRFVPRDVMLKKYPGKKDFPTTFHRRVGQRLGGGMVEYELIDNPRNKLPTAKDWDRVVAVVCLGQAWQFKDWPGKYSDPVQLFDSVFGFYVGMEGAKIPADLASWAVTQTKLNRDRRGLDSVTHAAFWNGVDEYMAIHKPEMLPQPES
eukprot:Nitzschia sp. Nitz4//scaffold44_size153857//113180//114655//NITZ4_002739-RA/size153857-processed-gene-0.164-mRNA-1//-1//CDS//3329552211//4572//frame0